MKTIFKDLRTYFMILLGISVIWFIYQMIRYPVLPMKYLIIVLIIILLLVVLLVLSQYKTKKNILKIIGKVGVVLLSIILLLVNYTYLRTVDLFSDIVVSEDTDVVSVVVKKESTYQHIEDLKGKTFAQLETSDDFINQTIEQIEKDNDETLNLKEYNGVNALVNALYDKQIDAMIINESYRSTIEESYETFTDDTRVIYSKTYQTKVDDTTDKDVTQDTFSIFISGIDTYGSISTKSRSDVNMIVTVNPQTKNILLTSIPRDYYVPFEVLNGSRDKLTHSGLYGVNETKNNVANYFGIDIDYYVRVNFTSVVDIVDAIGGINVDNPRAFNDFEAGNIHLNGEQALAFSRERYAFKEGDRERGRNQMRVITGIIQKVMSPSIITNYMSLLDSLHSSFQTNLTDEQIISLIRMQINDMSSWNIESISVDGTGDYLYSPIYGSELYMMLPDDNTVTTAKEKINALYE